MHDTPPIWAIVPAAGVGVRFGASVPKQYLPLAGRTVLQRSIDTLLQHPWIKGCVVALSASDRQFAPLNFDSHKPILTCRGGSTRADSVRNALIHLQSMQPEPEQMVAVHDAARPCLSQASLDHVLRVAVQDPVGAILAVPLVDTVKRQTAEPLQTLDRRELWAAQTPQVFRSQALLSALEVCDRTLITDEAHALECIGLSAQLVRGDARNLKITEAFDLKLAEFYLQLGS
jgi:2-C-methyl-D-erythritol 4-phosphate cytidylyltransferase